MITPDSWWANRAGLEATRGVEYSAFVAEYRYVTTFDADNPHGKED